MPDVYRVFEDVLGLVNVLPARDFDESWPFLGGEIARIPLCADSLPDCPPRYWLWNPNVNRLVCADGLLKQQVDAMRKQKQPCRGCGN